MNKFQFQQILSRMGINIWVPRKPTVVRETKSETKNGWDELSERVSNCHACELNKTRSQTVFGVGDKNAKLVIVGEAPGAHEDRLGEPFVGRAGKLLDAMLYSIGLDRQQVYIANILKCRPPNNRDPKPEEQALCAEFLSCQLELLQPKLILALGRIAAQYLLKTNLSLGRLRGTPHSCGEQKIPLFASYHPAYLLRSPYDKKKAYEDLLKVRDFLNLVIPAKAHYCPGKGRSLDKCGTQRFL